MTPSTPLASRGRRLLPLLVLPLLAGCFASPSGLGEVADDLERARERWRQAGLADYTITVRRLCFCHDPAAGAATVTVEDGVVVEVSGEDGGVLPREEWTLYPPVEGLFDVVEDAVGRDAARIDVSFDRELGSPRTLWIDYDARAVDEELGFDVGRPRPPG